MDDRTWQYLSAFEAESPEEVSHRLMELVSGENGVSMTDEPEEADLTLPRVGPVQFGPDCPGSKEDFFRWLRTYLKRRRNQKYDQLTGLYTRSHWERNVKPSVETRQWTVVMGDIDHFKEFNDNHGHDMGDRVLEAVGDELRNRLPGSCHLVRYGGEEVLVLFDESLNEASGRIETFRESLSETQLFAEQPSRITMSFGLAEHGGGSSLDDSIKRADLALYESKGSGRNQVTIYAPYLDYSNRFYAWGIYRYIWSPSVRFCLAEDGPQFLLMWEDSLQWYDWSDNESQWVHVPDECELPYRSIRRFRDGFVLLDRAGELWYHVPHETFEKVSDEDTPALARLTGQGTQCHAIGVNNQLYGLSEKRAERVVGLPPRWDDVVVTDEVYVVVENILIRWSDESCTESWPLPEPPRQVITSGSKILLVGRSGRMFTFRPDVNHWEQMQFMNLMESRIPCRALDAAGDRCLLMDEHGRLLLAYEGEERKKSVPQAMALREPSEA